MLLSPIVFAYLEVTVLARPQGQLQTDLKLSADQFRICDSDVDGKKQPECQVYSVLEVANGVCVHHMTAPGIPWNESALVSFETGTTVFCEVYSMHCNGTATKILSDQHMKLVFIPGQNKNDSSSDRYENIRHPEPRGWHIFAKRQE
jgi:hypothetical protein